MSKRVAIIFDGEHWFVRRIRVIEHDLKRDEKVYRCDKPIGKGHKTLVRAVSIALNYLFKVERAGKGDGKP